MRVERKLVTIEEVAYVSEDGMVFASESECQQHEKDLVFQKSCVVVKDLPYFSCSPENVDIDNSITFYFVRNEAELDAVMHHSFYDEDAEGWSFEAPAYPCWIRVLVNGDTGCGYISTFDEEVASAEGYVRELKKEKAKVEALFHLVDDIGANISQPVNHSTNEEGSNGYSRAVEKADVKYHARWVQQKALEVMACMNLNDEGIKMNAERELVAISTAMDSLKEMELFFKQVLGKSAE